MRISKKRNFIILETCRLIHYAEKPYKIYHWRSSHGAEVDLIIEAEDTLWAVEIKSYPTVKSGYLTGLKSFMEDHPKAKPLCVSTCETPYMAGAIPVIPWKYFFRKDFLKILE